MQRAAAVDRSAGLFFDRSEWSRADVEQRRNRLLRKPFGQSSANLRFFSGVTRRFMGLVHVCGTLCTIIVLCQSDSVQTGQRVQPHDSDRARRLANGLL